MSWKNFTLEEFACKHTGENKIEHELIELYVQNNFVKLI